MASNYSYDLRMKLFKALDDTLLSKQYSKKIEFVHYQYSGAVHDVIPGIVMVNLLHYNTKTDQST
ncbi:MAG: hypothetical protein O7C56_09780, partial [Rickettsia endosymbiont of Ixodes persulcatus]|nr:hypothetical protein [Rickettsia endosymbiont of Ixodes persulcatus]